MNTGLSTAVYSKLHSTRGLDPLSYEQWGKQGLLSINSRTDTQLQKEQGSVGIHLPNLEDLQKFVRVSGWQVLYSCDLLAVIDFFIQTEAFSAASVM